jgi:hypothetical protein
LTKDEAFDKLVDAVELTDSGSFESIDHAVVTAAQALNYIMEFIDESEESS